MNKRIDTFDTFLNEGKPLPGARLGSPSFRILYNLWANLDKMSKNLGDYMDVRAGSVNKSTKGLEPKFFLEMVFDSIEDIRKLGGLEAVESAARTLGQEDGTL